jgi:hypothetical protein
VSFSKRELELGTTVSATLTLLGLLLYLLTRAPYDAEGFWAPYIIATGGVGAMLLLVGFCWLVLALAHRHSHFFDADRPADANLFGVSMLVIVVVAGILIAVVLPRLPTTALSSLPGDPKARATIVRHERNFKLLTAAGVIVAAVAVASGPCRRFFRK